MNKKEWFEKQTLEVRQKYITIKRNYFESQAALAIAVFFLVYIVLGFFSKLPFHENLLIFTPVMIVFCLLGYWGIQTNKSRFLEFCKVQKLGQNECEEIMKFDWFE
mgnify:CR=1 FL=1